tara:strand:- start:297 stop:1586 length:1290 start_codon:yes stop_codon:yes gene_type:complete
VQKKVLLKAPVLTQSGYGEHSRWIFNVLLEREDLFDIYVEPLNWGKTGWQWQDTEERKKIDFCIGKFHHVITNKVQNAFDVCIHVDIPTAWKRVAPLMIGVTAGIEADAISPHWVQPSYQNVDKIIVPSTFSKQGFIEAIDKYSFMFSESDSIDPNSLKSNFEEKITVVHYPIKDYDLIDLNLNLKTDFNFLLVAQWSPRKNIKETIKSFLTEFKDDENVGLIIKTNLARNCIPDRYALEKKVGGTVSKFADAKCKIYLLHGFMTESEMHSLYHHPKVKAMINFGHGEGFGLPLFEAAYCGLPIITHDFGGQKDFLYAPKKDKKGNEKLRAYFSKVLYDVEPIHPSAVWEGVLEKDAEWAFPNFNSCKTAMREMEKSYNLHKGHAKKLQSWVKNNFLKEDKYAEMLEHTLGQELKIDEEVDDLFNQLEL